MHKVSIIAYLDRATGVCSCGFSKTQFGERRTANAKQSLLLHLESSVSEKEYHIKNGAKLICPLCKSDLELEESDKGLLLEDQPSVVTCEEGHEWDCYFTKGTLFLFATDEDGLFATN